MVKTSLLVRNERRRQAGIKTAAKRAALKQTAIDPSKSDDEREAARVALQKLPRNSNPCRVKNRCMLTGRGHAYYRKFGISRIMLRELAHLGELPGVKKSSW
jgi:small subunit ribosomal protein S14